MAASMGLYPAFLSATPPHLPITVPFHVDRMRPALFFSSLCGLVVVQTFFVSSLLQTQWWWVCMHPLLTSKIHVNPQQLPPVCAPPTHNAAYVLFFFYNYHLLIRHIDKVMVNISILTDTVGLSHLKSALQNNHI